MMWTSVLMLISLPQDMSEKISLPKGMPEKAIYLRGGVWNQQVELRSDEVVTLVGHSAGAHSVVSMAFDPVNCGKVKCVKLISGVYKVGLGVRLVSHGVFRGMSKSDASPLYHIPPAAPNSPAFELYYASRDLPGQRLQSIRMYDALRCAGYRVSLIEVCGNHYSIPCALGY